MPRGTARSISFCNGLTTDDVTGHEWTHAYTQYTHGLHPRVAAGRAERSLLGNYGETIDKFNVEK